MELVCTSQCTESRTGIIATFHSSRASLSKKSDGLDLCGIRLQKQETLSLQMFTEIHSICVFLDVNNKPRRSRGKRFSKYEKSYLKAFGPLGMFAVACEEKNAEHGP